MTRLDENYFEELTGDNVMQPRFVKMMESGSSVQDATELREIMRTCALEYCKRSGDLLFLKRPPITQQPKNFNASATQSYAPSLLLKDCMVSDYLQNSNQTIIYQSSPNNRQQVIIRGNCQTDVVINDGRGNLVYYFNLANMLYLQVSSELLVQRRRYFYVFGRQLFVLKRNNNADSLHFANIRT
ncbi:Hypothetical_protein [Hexamita inflata]|uniref:Hypothetical_protein n=1 Tax=Hexamita inflata TaxID=28002 RepID=A0ABP1KPT0_9EUKA